MKKNTTLAEPTQNRKLYLDIIRLLASFLVCYNHSHIHALFLSRPADGSLGMWVKLLLSVPTKMNIPLFFMLSGALLLGRQESYKTVLGKRLFRFSLLILVFNLAVAVTAIPGAMTPAEFLHAVLRGSINGSYWYLYAYLSFLLILPFLRKIAAQLTGQDVLFMVALRFLFQTVLPILNFWLPQFGLEPIAFHGNFSAIISSTDFVFYPLVGFYLVQLLPSEKMGRRCLLACGAAYVAGWFVSAAMTYAQGVYSQFSEQYLGLCNYAMAMALFVLLRRALQARTFPKPLGNFLRAASSTTIGIYLLEPIVGHYCRTAHYWNMKWGTPWETLVVLYYSVTWCIFCMTVGGVITGLLRRIPGVKKIL